MDKIIDGVEKIRTHSSRLNVLCYKCACILVTSYVMI